MRGRRLLPALVALALAVGAAAQEPPAQEPGARSGPPFLLLDQERLLTDSRPGQTLLAEEEAARDALRAEARDIDRRFEEEEQSLTERRATLPSEEFRRLADAFDERVIQARSEQDRRSDALVREFEGRRRQFYAEIGPILVGLLSRYDAYAILDEAMVLLADQSLNVTDAVIAEIDARYEAEAAIPDAEPAPEAEGE